MTKSKPEELKEVLFETLRGIQSGETDMEQARTIACTANSICNVVRTEIKVSDFNKARSLNQDKVDF